MTRLPRALRPHLARVASATLSIAILLSNASSAAAVEVDFGRDVRPILAANCFACHGPDDEHREAGLRLDDPEAAAAVLDSGERAIVPGSTSTSALIARIRTPDVADRMPPAKTGKTLSAKEIETLERWIAGGATWKEHWAYSRVVRPDVPDVEAASWPAGAIDRFLLDRLESEDLAPSAPADPVTLLRRLSFDLTGLPPEPADVAAFQAALDGADERTVDDAWAREVDRLLRSPHHGERMAVFWLDLVRFADTRGYHSDNPRCVAPYRDWVIRAFNENLPFDRFTREQLAGDLLDDPDVWQLVASCYNKLNQTTEEGGAQAKEYEAKNTADRVRNLSVVWMGATMACAECHNHKFDPLGIKDFYSLGAFFADIREAAIADRDAGIPVPSADDERELAEIDAELARWRSELDAPTGDLARAVDAAQAEWEASRGATTAPILGTWWSIGPFAASSHDSAFATAYPPEHGVDLEARYGAAAWKERGDWTDGEVHELEGSPAATFAYRTIEASAPTEIEARFGSDDGLRVWLNGEVVVESSVLRGVAPDQHRVRLGLRAGVNHLLVKVTNGSGGYALWTKFSTDDDTPSEILAIAKRPRSDRTEEEAKRLAAHFRGIAAPLAAVREQIARLETRRGEVEAAMSRCLVTVSAPPRTVKILSRGNWQDESGAIVEPAIPAYFGRLDVGDRRATRLDLAEWLVSRGNPLTARVFVNRLWKLFFGLGLSRRLEDLGAMGEPPVHPELLDWLAAEFMDSGWDVRHMIRLMVSSRVYRQSSIATAQHRERDPFNRKLARQSRWRIEAEMVRDNALAVSGLLSREIGGASAKPYQPDGYWVNLNFPKRRWETDQDDRAYRRGLYTWWQRSFLHPSLMAFDAPNREECTAERPRSNLPQQALVLLNDPTYVEAARVLAERAVEATSSAEECAAWMFERATSRRPDAAELDVLLSIQSEHARQYEADTVAAKELLGVGFAPRPEEDVARLAAWTSVARVILNLHETVTRN